MERGSRALSYSGGGRRVSGRGGAGGRSLVFVYQHHHLGLRLRPASLSRPPGCPAPRTPGFGGVGERRGRPIAPLLPARAAPAAPLHRCSPVGGRHPPTPRFALPSGARSPKDSLPSQAPNTTFRGDTSGMGVLPSTTTPPRKEKKTKTLFQPVTLRCA